MVKNTKENFQKLLMMLDVEIVGYSVTFNF